MPELCAELERLGRIRHYHYTMKTALQLILLCTVLYVVRQSSLKDEEELHVGGTCSADGCQGSVSCINRDDTPTMQELIELDVPTQRDPIRIKSKIGPNYSELGICLLNDNDGIVLQELKHDYPLTKDKLDAIFSSWLQGKGRRYGQKTNTWGRLIDCLNVAELRYLADNLKSRLCDYKDSAQKRANSVYKENADTLQDVAEPVANINYHRFSAELDGCSSSVLGMPQEVPSVVDREKFQQVFHLVATVCQLNKEISEKSSIDESNVIWNASIRLESIMKRLRMGRIRAGVVGLTKAGKSTTLNALLGKQFLPGSVQPQTAKEVSIVHTTGTDGELYGVKGEKRIPLGTGHQSIHDRLVKFNNESRKDKHIGYDTLYLHAPLTFLANKVQSVQFELSDTPGLGEAGSEQFSFESELAVRDMCAFVVIMKLDFLKTKTESELLLSLSTLHPKLFTNLNRILILINAYELSHRDKSKHNLQADKIQGYVSNYLREPNVLGKDIPHKHIITFSALWGLRARLWLANPEFLLDGTDARNLYNEALIELDRAGYDVQLLRGERTIEKVHNLSLLLEDFSHIKHVESNLTQMLHDNGASVLLESSVDDVLSVVDTIRTEISQMVIKENVTKKEKVVDNARYLLTSYKQTVEKYLNISTDLDDYIEASMRATLNTLAASLEESLNSLVNNKLYETLRGTVENEEKNHVQSRILSARSSILSPATTRMKMEWLRVVESIRRAIVEQLKVILSDLKLELVSGFSDDIGQSLLIDEEIIKKSHEVATLSSEMLNGLYDVAVSFLPPQSDGMDFELSYDGQGSEKVTDTALTQRLVQGKKTKYNMKSEKMCFGRRYVFAGPKDCVRYNVAEPYDVTTYSPDFVGLQSDFSEVVNGWIGRFTTQVNEHRSNVCETVASKFKSAVETALMLPVQQLEEDLQWKEAALKQSTHNVEYLKTKKEELNKEEMKLEEFLIDSRRE